MTNVVVVEEGKPDDEFSQFSQFSWPEAVRTLSRLWRRANETYAFDRWSQGTAPAPLVLLKHKEERYRPMPEEVLSWMIDDMLMHCSPSPEDPRAIQQVLHWLRVFLDICQNEGIFLNPSTTRCFQNS
jgi:hypothetical protein